MSNNRLNLGKYNLPEKAFLLKISEKNDKRQSEIQTISSVKFNALVSWGMGEGGEEEWYLAIIPTRATVFEIGLQ